MPKPKPREPERLLSVSDAAPVLVMSRSHVRYLTQRGVLQAAAVVVNGKRVVSLYRRSDVEDLARKRNRPQRTPTPTERRR